MESWISRRAGETANLERPRRGFLVAGTISTSGSLGSRRPSSISARCLIGRSRPAGEATDQGISGPALEGSNSKKCSGEEGLKWSEAAGGSEIALSGTRRRDDADHVAGELTANTKLTRTQRTRSRFGAVKLGSFSMVYCYAYITDYKETNLALSIRPSTIRTF